MGPRVVKPSTHLKSLIHETLSSRSLLTLRQTCFGLRSYATSSLHVSHFLRSRRILYTAEPPLSHQLGLHQDQLASHSKTFNILQVDSSCLQLPITTQTVLYRSATYDKYHTCVTRYVSTSKEAGACQQKIRTMLFAEDSLTVRCRSIDKDTCTPHHLSLMRITVYRQTSSKSIAALSTVGRTAQLTHDHYCCPCRSTARRRTTMLMVSALLRYVELFYRPETSTRMLCGMDKGSQRACS